MSNNLKKTLEQLEKVYTDFDDVMGDLNLCGSNEKDLREIYWTYQNADNAFCELLNEIRAYCENHS